MTEKIFENQTEALDALEVLKNVCEKLASNVPIRIVMFASGPYPEGDEERTVVTFSTFNLNASELAWSMPRVHQFMKNSLVEYAMAAYGEDDEGENEEEDDGK